MTTNVLHCHSLVCIDPARNKDAEYHVQVISTSGGYACIAQHGRRNTRLKESFKGLEHVPYHMALREFRDAITAKSGEYEFDAVTIPENCERYADADYRIIRPDELEDFRAEHEASIGNDEASAARSQAIRTKRESAIRARAAEFEAILRNPATALDLMPESNATIEKVGSKIASINIDENTARAIGREIGGSFKARGMLVGTTFHVVEITSASESAESLLMYARPEIVTANPPTNLVSTHGEMLDAVRAIVERRNMTPVRLALADGSRYAINPVDIVSLGDFLSPDVFESKTESAVS